MTRCTVLQSGLNKTPNDGRKRCTMCGALTSLNFVGGDTVGRCTAYLATTKNGKLGSVRDMTERERLAEMIAERVTIRECCFGKDKQQVCEDLADFLIAHGKHYVPRKRDQEIWAVGQGRIHRCVVRDIIPRGSGNHVIRLDRASRYGLEVSLNVFDKCCYFTYREAHNALLQKLKEDNEKKH